MCLFMRDSLKVLLEEYPYFITKKEDTNQYKSEWVFNQQFQKLYQRIYETYLSTKIEKHILINKVQKEPGKYDLNFYINLKNIQIFIDSEIEPELIHSTEFSLESETYQYTYTYNGTCDGIIPEDKFYITVETWDEYEFCKGYPQIASKDANDKYCIDYSLDEVGSLLDFPRLYFTSTENYENTYPLFNN